MREVDVNIIRETIEGLIEKAAFELPEDVLNKLKTAETKEYTRGPKEILFKIVENAKIAGKERLPLCQDCGLAIIYLDIGQEVAISGGDLNEAINNAVKNSYRKNHLRKSVVASPVNRTNTGDNTPAIIHYNIIPGDKIHTTVMLKGGGCENMSYSRMLTPAEGEMGIKKFVLESVLKSGGNPCPPIVVGIGVGGDFEYAAYLAKKSLLRELGTENSNETLNRIEKELLEGVNKLGIGPQGFGGLTTALAVHMLEAPCHIASLPVAINIECHSHRHKEAVI